LGLKPEFEALRTQILNTSPMPSLYEAYATIDSDERRRRLGPLISTTVSASPVIAEQMAFVANSGPRSPSWRPICHHYGVVGHLKARCFKLHPELRQTVHKNRPPNFSSTRIAAIAETTGNSATLSDFSRLQAQIGQLQDQLGSLVAQTHDTPIAPITTIATGTPIAFHVRSGEPIWVLDSGANDHMTGESSIFSSPLIPVTQSVSLADGSTSHISHKGDVFLSSDIMLSSVLHIPNFAFNLLSVSRLAKSLNCAVIFLPFHCLLQDLSSKKIFGRGYERDGLYYFGDLPPATSGLQGSILPSSSSYVFSFKTLTLWHAHLGHVNFQYLWLLFPSFIKACKDHKFQCEVCELSKHTRTSYIPRMHRPSSVFDLIHSDVWDLLQLWLFLDIVIM
jgi:hypothetical protein